VLQNVAISTQIEGEYARDHGQHLDMLTGNVLRFFERR